MTFRGAITSSIGLWVAGTLLTIMFFVGIVYPWLLGVWYGSCWSDARSELRAFGKEMEGAIRSPSSPPMEYRMSLGKDCIAAVLFFNGKEKRDVYNKLFEAECEEQYDGYKAYMVAIPKQYILIKDDQDFKKEFGDQLDDIKSFLQLFDKIRLWINDKMGRIPHSYCYELEHDFSSLSLGSIPEGFMQNWKENWNKGGLACLRVSPVATSEGGYNYLIEAVTPCSEEIDYIP